MKKSFFALVVTVVVIGSALAWVLFNRLDFRAPEVKVTPQVSALGARTVLHLAVTDKGSGIAAVEVAVKQGDRQSVPLKVEYPVRGLRQGTGVSRQDFEVVIEPRRLGLAQGPAEVDIQVRDASWWPAFAGNTTAIRQPVQVDWRPPVVQVLTSTLNLNRGGAGFVIYKIEEDGTNSGVRVGDRFFPGFPCSLGKGLYCAYLAWPADMETPPGNLMVVARDAAGNEGRAGLFYHLREKAFRDDKLELSEQFLTNTVAKLLPAAAAGTSPVNRFLEVNRVMREANHKVIREVCSRSNPNQLWKGPFMRLRDTAPMAAFGDRRTYLYNGQDIDRQTHLGVDLASTAGAPVGAANSGQVAYADELGIYGNCIIIDHGQGIFSLYGHLSSIECTVGQRVNQNQIIGRTGSTGLAGGDHLHFSILVSGTFVNPIEWWDSHWIKDNVELKYAQAKEALAPPPPPPGPGKAPSPDTVIR